MDLLISIVLCLITQGLWTVFTNRDFNALACKNFAKWRALNNSREFLGRIDLELFGEAGGENGCPASVKSVIPLAAPDVNKVHLQSVR